MARIPGGHEHLEAARKLLREARTVNELRLAQSVLLPLELGLSLDQTAAAIGLSRRTTSTMRTRFAHVSTGEARVPGSKFQLRNRAKADLNQEAQVLKQALEQATQTGVTVVPQIKPLIEAHLGQSLALASVYRMLARHGWHRVQTGPQCVEWRQA